MFENILMVLGYINEVPSAWLGTFIVKIQSCNLQAITVLMTIIAWFFGVGT